MKNHIPSYFQKIETELQKNLPSEPDCLLAPIKDLLNRGGKRWRPLLSLLIAEGLESAAAVLPLAPLVEFSHNASLIHDDIEDNSPLRRGKPTCHILYGNDAALNSGSFLYFLAARCIENWNNSAEKKLRVYNLWINYLCRLHAGQALDINWHNDFFLMPSINDYLRMCADKTGCLAEFSAALALIVTYKDKSANKKNDVLLKAAGNLGIAFQIIDDVKNLRGEISGKKGGDDIVEGKKSLPVLIFCDHGGERAVSFTAHTFMEARKSGVDSSSVKDFICALEKDGAIDEAEKSGTAMLEKAFSVFEEYAWLNSEKTREAFREFRKLIE